MSNVVPLFLIRHRSAGCLVLRGWRLGCRYQCLQTALPFKIQHLSFQTPSAPLLNVTGRTWSLRHWDKKDTVMSLLLCLLGCSVMYWAHAHIWKDANLLSIMCCGFIPCAHCWSLGARHTHSPGIATQLQRLQERIVLDDELWNLGVEIARRIWTGGLRNVHEAITSDSNPLRSCTSKPT